MLSPARQLCSPDGRPEERLARLSCRAVRYRAERNQRVCRCLFLWFSVASWVGCGSRFASHHCESSTFCSDPRVIAPCFLPPAPPPPPPPRPPLRQHHPPPPHHHHPAPPAPSPLPTPPPHSSAVLLLLLILRRRAPPPLPRPSPAPPPPPPPPSPSSSLRAGGPDTGIIVFIRRRHTCGPHGSRPRTQAAPAYLND